MDHAAHEAPLPADVGLEERLGGKLPLDAVLKDESGKPVRLGDLLTGPTLVLPVYFSCTNVCNFMQWGAAGVIPSLPGVAGRDYRVLSISIDENDTPQVAARARKMYLEGLKSPIQGDGWRFLTGDIGTVRQITDAAGYHFKRQGRDFVHPVVSFVTSGDGIIVRYLYGTRFLSKDLALAFVEARQGVAGATIRKMVEYCFSFDPQSKSYQFNLLRVSATVVIACTGGFLLFLMVTGKRKPVRRSTSH